VRPSTSEGRRQSRRPEQEKGAQRSTYPEVSERNTPGPISLIEQQRCNEETGDYEEDIDSNDAALRVEAKVACQNDRHGEGAKAI
jgi:hypothetical protein